MVTHYIQLPARVHYAHARMQLPVPGRAQHGQPADGVSARGRVGRPEIGSVRRRRRRSGRIRTCPVENESLVVGIPEPMELYSEIFSGGSVVVPKIGFPIRKKKKKRTN